MKKFLLPLLMIALLLATATPALAGTGPKGRRPFALVGTITAINDSEVTVKVVTGNRLVKPYLGEELQIRTNDLTRFLMRLESGDVQPITIADLAVGQNVSINGIVKGETWTAKRITVGPELLHLP